MSTIPSIAMIPSAYKASKLYSVLPLDGGGDLDVVRASGATRVDKDEVIEEVANNVPRIDYSDGGCPILLLEPQGTNLYLNSETLSTQDVATSATNYTVSFYGTGTITFSGTYVGSLVGTGVSDRVSLTFTATAGTLTSTVSNTVSSAQIEQFSYATSYIPTTGATATRLGDEISKAGISSFVSDDEGVLYAEISALSDDLTFRTISLSDGTTNNNVGFGYRNNSNVIYTFLKSDINSSSLVQVSDITDLNKVAIKYKSGDFAMWVNGTEVFTSTTVFSLSGLNSISFNNGSGAAIFYGKNKDLRVYNTALSDAELKILTTL